MKRKHQRNPNHSRQKTSEVYMNTETVDQPNSIAEELTLVQNIQVDQLTEPSQENLENQAPAPAKVEITKPVNAVTTNLYTPLSKLKNEEPKMNHPALKTIPIDTSDLEESKSEEMIALEQMICKIDPTEDRIATSISRASTNEGNTKTPDGMKIDGTFIGNIDIINAEGYEDKHGTVFVNETGKVIGNITGKRVVIAGEVRGNVTSSTQLIIAPTGKVFGDLNYNQLIVLENAEHEGCNRRLTREEILKLLQPVTQ